MTEYRAALWGDKRPEKPADSADSLSALIDAYKQSPQWARLKPATQRQRDNIFVRIKKVSGYLPASEIDPILIKKTRDSLGPGAAKHYVQSLRGVFQWAVEIGRLASDPTASVKVARPKTDGFHTWTDAEIAQYEAKWPIGTKQRLWMALLLYTGLRRGDACVLGQQHIKNGTIEFRAAKNSAPIIIPLAPELASIIKASPTHERSFIGLTKESFGNLFREATAEAGVPGTAHGLRKAAAVRLAEAGATVAELNAVFGWTGAKMALLYIEKADRAKLARQAMQRSSMFSPPKGKNRQRSKNNGL